MNIPAPFNQNQLEYLKRTFNSWFNVAEGGKRGSKNVLNTYAFCLNIETHPNKIHLIAGVTNSTARINVAVCDGFGIFNYFEGRYKEGKFQDRHCIYVQTKVGEKVILVAGGRKDGDEAFIKGFTLGSAYVTEANECHIKFLKEVFDRTISSNRRRIFHDLNPKDPNDKYYVEILNFYEQMQKEDASFGYNYGHFTIADNMSVSNSKLRAILKTYKKDTVWYRRDILGERAVAEGLCFRYFADEEEKYLIDEKELYKSDILTRDNLKEQFSHLIIGVDFGDNGSMYTWCATGFYNNWQNLIPLIDGGIDKSNDINTTKLCVEFLRFYELVLIKYGSVDYVFCDSASNTLINTLRAYLYDNGYDGSVIRGVVKNEIKDRPKLIDMLLCTGRMRICVNCTNVRKALKSLVWDKKKPDVPEDLNIDNINDYYDSYCYTFITHTAYIESNR